MKKCPGCGKECQDTDVFCEMCGTRLAADYERSDAETSHEKPLRIQASHAELSGVKSLSAESSGVKPLSAESLGIKPLSVESSGIKPLGAESLGIKPLSVESSGIKPLSTESSGIKSLSAESSGIKPVSTESSGIKPLSVEPPRPGAPHDSQGKSGKGKSPVPVLVGCAAVALLMIAATIACVFVLNGKKEDMSAASAKEALTASIDEKDAGPVSEEAQDAKKEEDTVGMNQEEDTEAGEAGEAGVREENAGQAGASAANAEEADKQMEDLAESQTENGGDHEADGTAVKDAAADSRTAGSDSETNYATYYVVNCNESITLRKSPSTKAGEICQIPLGAAVSYVEAAENGFYKIIYNGKTGYGLASYLDTVPQGQTEGTSSAANDSSVVYMKVVNCNESITLRKIPSTQGEEFCQIPLGSKVEYLGTAENGFYMVSYNGYTGYALASYLTEW